VIAALYDAFAEGGDLDQARLVRALAEALPLSVTMREEIDRVREWARSRTRPASGSVTALSGVGS
jgi:hypothetical protein